MEKFVRPRKSHNTNSTSHEWDVLKRGSFRESQYHPGFASILTDIGILSELSVFNSSHRNWSEIIGNAQSKNNGNDNLLKMTIEMFILYCLAVDSYLSPVSVHSLLICKLSGCVNWPLTGCKPMFYYRIDAYIHWRFIKMTWMAI